MPIPPTVPTLPALLSFPGKDGKCINIPKTYYIPKQSAQDIFALEFYF